MRIVVASGNLGKLRELSALLSGLDFELLTQSSCGVNGIEETGASFLHNALLKARHASRETGLPALADDSGLEVDALGGAPGIHSARYAGPAATDADNNAKLVRSLAGVPAERRTARYRCVLAFVRSGEDQRPLIAEGAWEGRIVDSPRGHGGFGYDPHFCLPDLGKTAAELDAQTKNALSHRGQAMRRLRQLIEAQRRPAQRRGAAT
jgi:XTP/dITP diphosphohydrolase